MFQPTAQDSRVCRSPDPGDQSADEAGGAAGETLSLASYCTGASGTTSAFKVNASCLLVKTTQLPPPKLKNLLKSTVFFFF